MQANEFRVPNPNKQYHLDQDFDKFNAGSIISINYPSGKRWGGYFSLHVYKKYNKDSPAKRFGCAHYNMIALDRLKATELDEKAYNNIDDENINTNGEEK